MRQAYRAAEPGAIGSHFDLATAATSKVASVQVAVRGEAMSGACLRVAWFVCAVTGGVWLAATVFPERATAALADADGDGVPDTVETFLAMDPHDPDSDHDGLLDGDELAGWFQWGQGSATDPDSDHDGIDDLHDDADGDGLSALEERVLGSNRFLADSDHDGVPDGYEVAHGTDPVLRDTDGDGVRDGDEDDDGDGATLAVELETGSDPADPDTDHDGLADDLEATLCTSPLDGDSDHDGIPDAADETICIARTPAALPDWKLVQRSVTGTAAVAVPVRFRLGRSARLEVAVLDQVTGAPLPGHGYADHPRLLDADTSPGGAAASVDLPAVPQGGPYRIVARVVDPASGSVLVSDAVHDIAVGDVFLAAGQSNMSGVSRYQPPATYEPPDPQVHLFGNDWRWKLAVEPMDDPSDSVDDVGIDTLARGSPMLRFAKEVAGAAGVPVAIVPASSSGASLMPPPPGDSFANRWVRDPGDPLSRRTLYGAAVSRVLAQGYADPIKGVIWYQGEEDTTVAIEPYVDRLDALVANLRADLGSPEILFAGCQISHPPAWQPEAAQLRWLNIREAQRRYAASDPHAVLVATYDLPNDGTAHLAAPARPETGRRLAMAVLARAYGIRTQVAPALRRIRLLHRGSQIMLAYDGRLTGTAPSIRALDPSLFRVEDRGAPVPIVKATRSATRVKLVLATPATATALLSYGVGGGNGSNFVVGRGGGGSVLCFRDLPVTTGLRP
jgi:hypothetical protein